MSLGEVLTDFDGTRSDFKEDFHGFQWAHSGKSAINNGIFNGLIMKLDGFHIFSDIIRKFDQRDVFECGSGAFFWRMLFDLWHLWADVS